ncbi:ABC-2 type transport system permease protein [Paenisporosarcina quisquiliarum]|uniref:ABC transporter permease n=1 Tax=Psychrobacillus psychrodurans TaxID=126157 RepID=A0A9X3LAR8_9BACI|nr:ABC transporter permease [Psychrobacillus psychrodurans]MCZ8533256.1 ABC transporter permease [Psychrobacillus psychrodurans]SEM59314.1 ABC-2 type transport system permease protein [Paenisporosarcina quisquiliarum]
MFSLIQNEWMKLWHKKGTWAILGILLLVIIGVGVLDKVTMEEVDTSNWKQEQQVLIDDANAQLKTPDLDEWSIQMYEEQKAMAQYRLDNNAAPQVNQSMEGNMAFGASIMVLITLLTVIPGASIVSQEFTDGTIKMLLTRPVSRFKILTSKLITIFLFGLSLIVLTIILTTAIGFILFGTATGIDLTIVDGVVQQTNTISDVFLTYVYSLGDFTMSILFAFFIGTVFSSPSIAIALSMLFLMMGPMIILLLQKYIPVEYIWLTHSDLTQHLTKEFFVEETTLSMSLTVLVIYAIVFLALSFMTFIKRDVKA